MATAAPAYNVKDSPSLLACGRLQGQAVQVDPASIAPRAGGRIYRATLNGPNAFPHLCGGVFGSVAIKVTEDDRTRKPRDPRREALMLADLDHPNILALLNAYLSEPSATSPEPRIMLFTPYYPLTLRNLLDSPSFSPDISQLDFEAVATSIACQLSHAIAHLHERGIAHRDLNPHNVVLSSAGRVVSIDFGISVETGQEKPGEMHFEVGTGAYRAPELIFASRDYDPADLDLWALGCTLADLYRPLALPVPPSPPSSEGSFERYYRECATPEPEPKLSRRPLFDASSSDFVLAASIFRVLGTPTLETWPEATRMPNFAHFTFASFPATPLGSHLPYLQTPSPTATILPQLLQISATKRVKASAVVEAFRGSGEAILAPDDLSESDRRLLDSGGGAKMVDRLPDGRLLRELLAAMVAA